MLELMALIDQVMGFCENEDGICMTGSYPYS